MTDITLGYKEFADFLSEPQSTSTNPSAVSLPKPNSFIRGVELMKLSTRQYARKQVKWIKNRLAPAVNAVTSSTIEDQERAARLYLLDATGKGFSDIGTFA